MIELTEFKKPGTEFYPKEKFWHEMYGKLILHSELHSSNENRNLQYITNKLFVAAACDVAIENEKKKLKFLETRSEEQETRLSELEKYPPNFNLQVLNNKLRNKFSQEVSGLDYKLKLGYQDLKNQIDEVRIFGVQKSTKEKFNTVMKNCVKAVVSVLRVPAHLAVDAFIHHGKIESSKRNLSNPTRVVSKLGMIRDESKRRILELKGYAKNNSFLTGISGKLWKKKEEFKLR